VFVMMARAQPTLLPLLKYAKVARHLPLFEPAITVHESPEPIIIAMPKAAHESCSLTVPFEPLGVCKVSATEPGLLELNSTLHGVTLTPPFDGHVAFGMTGE
jgi:hypothetical protein